MKINNRLKAIANYVENNSNVIDVGCDHSLLGIYLCLNNDKIKVISSDINNNPLLKAQENIDKYNLNNKIKIKIGDGITTIEEDTDTIVISGMGGKTIIEILYDCNKLKNIKKIILSPNNDIDLVRKHLVKIGFYITKEELVKERDKIYTIIEFQKGKKKYAKIDYLYGPLLKKEKNSLFLELIENEKNRLNNILNSIPQKNFLLKYKIIKKIKLINKI